MTAVFALQRKKLGCVKTLQNFCKICLFSLQNFAFWMQNLRFFFAKNRGDRPISYSSVRLCCESNRHLDQAYCVFILFTTCTSLHCMSMNEPPVPRAQANCESNYRLNDFSHFVFVISFAYSTKVLTTTLLLDVLLYFIPSH